MKAQAKELGQSPPIEFFVSLYFQAREWWVPLGREQSQPDADNPVVMQFANPDLPEYED